MIQHRPFIETQFPLARLSLESYKERKAGSSQTLTGLGKWWGRKPLILVRASLLGLLMPSSDDPEKDREIFYKILTMDDDGLWRRKSKRLSAKEISEILDESETINLIEFEKDGERWKNGILTEEKEKLEKLAFARLTYEKKLEYCARPEEIDGPSSEAWDEINRHLGTDARTLQELFLQLSEKAFGHIARVGDCFCGGGSVPFEAARLGLEAYGSDLNPVAALLTWGAIHLVGGGKEVHERLRITQEEAWEKADAQITEWGIEHDDKGNRADAYLYCVEVKCPATGLWVPLAPSWVISEKYKVVAVLKRNDARQGYDIEILTGATDQQIEKAKSGTVRGSSLIDPEDPNRTFSIASLRGDQRGQSYGLRLWENEDLVPRPDDVFQERLYCVRWVTPQGERLYRSVTEEDLQREEKVLALLKERFSEWQEKGFIPSKKISPGYNTEQPIRERGWTHWHHLFNPRQLLTLGLLSSLFKDQDMIEPTIAHAISLLSCADWNSRLCRWTPQLARSGGIGASTQTFYNQALNTLFCYALRPQSEYKEIYLKNFWKFSVTNNAKVFPLDARDINIASDIWITDPPYADAVNYHELADFFLAWYEKQLPKLFPDWYTDSHSALAVRGADEDFKKSMVEIYANLSAHMPDNGLQLVMFTHQDSAVWADLGMILWAAGLRVTAAWTIGTETSSGLKQGNYVQGTVLLVLRKRLTNERAWLDELYPKVDDEVCTQLDLMKDMDDINSPQFSDTDYQLGAYAAALRVLTSYATIEGMDIKHELLRARKKGEKSEFQKVIDRAVTIATNHRIPRGIEKFTWRNLDTQERLYLSGLEIERHGEVKQGAYMELARGFGVQEYKIFLADTQANQARFKTASEFGRVGLSGDGFASSLLRHLLFAVYETTTTDDPSKGLAYLKNERVDYWSRKEDIIAILNYLSSASTIGYLVHWRKDAESASLLAGLVYNDYVGSR